MIWFDGGLMCVIGYKLHRQISKGLQRRSEAIRKAITRYNIQAAALNPPRPLISWKDITQYTFLGEFDLLRHTRDDVREHIWARPAVRDATAKFFKLSRAKEEITRLNVEIRCLQTAIHSDEGEVSQTIADLRDSAPMLAGELERLYRSRAAVNAIHLHRLHHIEKQYGLAKQRGIGIHARVFSSIDEDLSEPIGQDGDMAPGNASNTPAAFQNEDLAPGDVYVRLYNRPPNLLLRFFSSACAR